MSWVAPASTSNLTGYPGDLKFPGRCDRFETNFSSIWGPRFDTHRHIWSLNWLTFFLFVTREEVPPLASDLDKGADEEANSPAGGAREDGGVVVEGQIESTSRL